ncbi:hypothetical protein MRB53_004424 [Persea americana]|uniref:Uncharacterized protein n=1 Tax=Persea americana TaxID=3435 RepID=A0ACC2MAM9_PERAE|nr:hypothetical protein MRB53_004424 [Persea americana]
MASEGGGGENQQLLLNNHNSSSNNNEKKRKKTKPNEEDELSSFRSWIRWVCVDQSNSWLTFLSWSLFLILAVGVPLLSLFILSSATRQRWHYDLVVQLSLTAISALSFFCLSHFTKLGLRRFLFLDKLCRESEKVRQGYTDQLNRSFKILSYFVIPCFIAESTYKIWWYCTAGSQIPFLGNVYILRLEDFIQVFQEECDAAMVLQEHLRIRRQLKVISHRFRAFIVSTLIIVTASQLAALLITTRSHAEVDIFKAGELALCSIGLVAGLFMCLRSATKITHKAQAITSHAAKWHMCATINSFDTADCETPVQITSGPQFFAMDTDSSEEAMDGDDVDDTAFIPTHAHTISFQKRAALVTYFENNQAGITVFGFMLDRMWIYAIIVIELTLVLWLLGNTVGIS